MSKVTVLDAPARSFEAAAASACSTEAFNLEIRYLLYYCGRANYCIKRIRRARASLTALPSMNLLSHNSTVASENNATVKAEALAKENSLQPGLERRTHAWQAGSHSLS